MNKVETIQEAIKLLRDKFKVSQSQLAKELGVSHTTVSLWERGKSNIKPDNAYVLYKKFDVLVVSVFKDENEIKGYEEWLSR